MLPWHWLPRDDEHDHDHHRHHLWSRVLAEMEGTTTWSLPPWHWPPREHDHNHHRHHLCEPGVGRYRDDYYMIITTMTLTTTWTWPRPWWSLWAGCWRRWRGGRGSGRRSWLPSGTRWEPMWLDCQDCGSLFHFFPAFCSLDKSGINARLKETTGIWTPSSLGRRDRQTVDVVWYLISSIYSICIWLSHESQFKMKQGFYQFSCLVWDDSSEYILNDPRSKDNRASTFRITNYQLNAISYV